MSGPQNIELGATGGAAKQDSTNMDDMSVEQMAVRANQLTDESLESTRRMLQMAEESQQTGNKTMEMLDHQAGELTASTFHHCFLLSPRPAVAIITHQKESVQLVCKAAEGFKCKLLWVSSIENDSRYKRTWGKGNSKGSNVVSRQPSGVRNGQTAQTNAAAAPSGPYINRVTNDAREDEMEDNLQAVGGIIGNMKDMALNMGNEIDKQNVQIDRINDKVTCINKAHKKKLKLK
ncbi:PREDICTED: synaptosomal-associated protein 23-like [Poecilia mexicana]|uniref:synaptosomal-associated protein 23-like n=1 Tax=Poecilia mexicana TaxID=48701 RepID=UPI00072DF43B|nr:PREDICTED: synaptosomal-associated protein 23-like [Poecilia mexicana]